MSQIDGCRVNYRGHPDWEGIVMGDGLAPGSVRVNWHKAVRPGTGTHQITDLVLVPKKEEPAVDPLL